MVISTQKDSGQHVSLYKYDTNVASIFLLNFENFIQLHFAGKNSHLYKKVGIPSTTFNSWMEGRSAMGLENFLLIVHYCLRTKIDFPPSKFFDRIEIKPRDFPIRQRVPNRLENHSLLAEIFYPVMDKKKISQEKLEEALRDKCPQVLGGTSSNSRILASYFNYGDTILRSAKVPTPLVLFKICCIIDKDFDEVVYDLIRRI